MDKKAVNPERLYENVGPTAWRVAYFRAQSDIPYAADIFQELDALIKPTDPTVIEYMASAKTSVLAPQFEARHKLINKLIAANPSDLILELAAGLSPRGLELTDANKKLQYVATDLPEMINNVRALFDSLINKGQVKTRSNLHLKVANALNHDQLCNAIEGFGRQPLTMVHEGLLRYLDFDQKATVAKNIHSLLEHRGGCWITSDITLKKILIHERERTDNRRRIKAFSGIDVEANCFDSVDAAQDFFEDLAFTVEIHPFLEVINDLVSPAKINLAPDAVADIIRYAVVFVMRLK